MNPAGQGPLLCLLPGLDGTGLLYGALEAELSCDHDLQVIGYPPDRFGGYQALADEVSGRLPLDRGFVIVAESFAGPLAILIAARKPAGLLGVVIAASFLHQPVRASGFLARLLNAMPSSLPLPLGIIEHVLMGRWKNSAIRQGLDVALSSVEASVLKARLKAALLIDARGMFAQVEVPVLNIRATRDGLLQRRANFDFDAGCCERVELEAPHFVFQAVAREAADTIRSFVKDKRIFQ
ncbi:MAG: hypothetical protein ABIP44_13795 [Pseudoxanthomonas sp.]